MNINNPDSPMLEEAPSQDINEPTESSLKLIEGINLAKDLSEDTLTELGLVCSEGFESDLQSRSDWERDLETWTKLAMQIREEKSFPWRNASNVKYPLISTAAMQFSARAYPTLVPSSGSLVKPIVIGKDVGGVKLAKAQRACKYMSYQLLHKIDNWEENMDRLLIMLAVAGCIFRKIYWNKEENQPSVETILPSDLVVDNWTTSLEEAERISHRMYVNKRKLISNVKAGKWIEADLDEPTTPPKEGTGVSSADDAATPWEIIEQHLFYDLDNDGIDEPVIVTFERQTRKVLRVVNSFTEKEILTSDDGEIVGFKRINFFVKYSFVPNPSGCFYDIGFGSLLGPLNEAINSLVNQLIDAGTINNLQSGFIGKGIKLKPGEQILQPGEWKQVPVMGDDLKKQIVPLPGKEPSAVLFQLMQALVTSGKELASVAEIFVGKMPGQNTPATTTQASIAEGMRVFTSIYKRVYRSLTKEFKLLFRLNEDFHDPYSYQQVLDEEINPDDFNTSVYDVCPTADPNAASDQEAIAKQEALLNLLPLGILNPVEVTHRILVARDYQEIEKLFMPGILEQGLPPPPPPDPKMMEMQMKQAAEQEKSALKKSEIQHKMAMEQQSKEAEIAMKAQEHHQKMMQKSQEAELDGQIAVHKQQIFSVTEQAKTNQALANQQASHQQKLQQTKEVQRSAPSQPQKSSKGGKPTR